MSQLASRRVVRPEAERTGGKTMGELAEAHDRVMDGQPMVVSCAVERCGWRFEGSAAEARDRALAHREKRHPELRQLSRVERERKVKRQRQADAAARAEMARQREALAALDAGAPQPPLPPQPAAEERRPVRPTRAEQDAARNRRKTKWTAEKAVAAIQAFHAEHGHPPALSNARGSGGVLPSETSARALFGSWADAIVAAGYERPTRGSSYGRLAQRLRVLEEPVEEAEPPAAVSAPSYCVSCGFTSPYTWEACGSCGSNAIRPWDGRPVRRPFGTQGLPIVKAPPAPQEPVSRPTTPPPVPAPIPAPTDDTRPLSASQMMRLAVELEAAARFARSLAVHADVKLTAPQRRHLAELARIARDGFTGEAYWTPVGSGELQCARKLQRLGLLSYATHRSFAITAAGLEAVR